MTWHKVHTATPRASKSCQRVVSCYGVFSFHTIHRNTSSRLFTDGTSRNSRPQSGGARQHKLPPSPIWQKSSTVIRPIRCTGGGGTTGEEQVSQESTFLETCLSCHLKPCKTEKSCRSPSRKPRNGRSKCL